MDIITYAMAKSNADSAIIAAISQLPNGIVFRGAVSYYSDLPASPEVGDAYTVMYQGSSGSIADGREFVWGEYNNVVRWIEIGVSYESKAAADGGTDLSLVTTGEKYRWNNKSDFSGNVNDLVQTSGDTLILNSGTASENIENYAVPANGVGF